MSDIIIKDFYEKTRLHIEHEDSLINHRLTWLLMINGFLFTAFGFSLNAEAGGKPINVDAIRAILAVAGLSASITLFCGITAAILSMRQLVECWNTIIDKDKKITRKLLVTVALGPEAFT